MVNAQSRKELTLCPASGAINFNPVISSYDGSSGGVFYACGWPFYGAFFSFRLAYNL